MPFYLVISELCPYIWAINEQQTPTTMSTTVPTLSLQHTTQDGKRAIRIVVRGNMGEQGRELLISVGMVGVSDMANTYEAICTTPEQIDAVRKPILAAYAYKVVGSNVELHPKN